MQISATPAVSAPSQSSADLLAQNIIYSANVGGKDYVSDITASGGLYVATIPDLPNIHASGSSLLLAETNLDARISLLV